MHASRRPGPLRNARGGGGLEIGMRGWIVTVAILLTLTVAVGIGEVGGCGAEPGIRVNDHGGSFGR